MFARSTDGLLELCRIMQNSSLHVFHPILTRVVTCDWVYRQLYTELPHEWLVLGNPQAGHPKALLAQATITTMPVILNATSAWTWLKTLLWRCAGIFSAGLAFMNGSVFIPKHKSARFVKPLSRRRSWFRCMAVVKALLTRDRSLFQVLTSLTAQLGRGLKRLLLLLLNRIFFISMVSGLGVAWVDSGPWQLQGLGTSHCPRLLVVSSHHHCSTSSSTVFLMPPCMVHPLDSLLDIPILFTVAITMHMHTIIIREAMDSKMFTWRCWFWLLLSVWLLRSFWIRCNHAAECSNC